MSQEEIGQYITVNGRPIYVPPDPRNRLQRTSYSVNDSNSGIVEQQKEQAAAKIQGQQDDFIKRLLDEEQKLNDEFTEITGENLLADNLTDRYAGKSKLNKQLAKWRQFLSNKKATGYIRGTRSIHYAELNPSQIDDQGNLSSTDKNLFYVQMRTLLNWIEDNVLLYNKSISQPIFKIDTGNKNYMLHFPKQISANPKVCIIPVKDGKQSRKKFNEYRKQYSEGRVDKAGNTEYKENPNTKKFEKNPLFNEDNVEAKEENPDKIFYGRLPAQYITAKNTTQKLPENFLIQENSYIADIMYIDLNLDFIASVTNDNIDLDGNLNFVTFIKEMLNGVKASLGYINNFELIYDKETNFFKILDNNILKYGKLKNKNYAPERFVVNGFDPVNITGQNQSALLGSFIENVNFTSTLDNKFASMVSIAAQSDTNVVGMSTTGLSKFNNGLVDRVIPKKQSKDEIENGGKGLAENDLAELYNNAKALAEQMYGEFRFSDDDIDIFMSLNRDIANYEINQAAKGDDPKIPPPLVIPFNLSLQMMGLSGMRINERFDVSEKILPPMFDNNSYNFIIKAVSHEIKGNKWTTTLESQVINKEDPNAPPIPVSDVDFEKFTTSTLKGSTNSSCPAPAGWPGPVPYKSTVLSLEEAVDELKRLAPNEKNLQIFTLMVMIIEQGGPIKGFNNNFGGIDITNGGWKYDSNIHDGYVCAKEGGTGEMHAFASFRNKGDSLKFKLDTFRSRGFGADDMETNIDLQSYISVFAGNKNKKRKSDYGTDKGQYYSITVPKFSAAYFNDWNGWGTVSVVKAGAAGKGDDNARELAKLYTSEKAYTGFVVKNNQSIWNRAKRTLGYT